MGFSGINNEPFVSMYGPFFADQLESAGIGFSREMELIRRAREHDLLNGGMGHVTGRG
jgi:predicted TIM-barrel enzyme